MMLYPAMSELLKQVPSRYQLVNVVAARARKIAARAEREGLMLEEKPVSIAVQEIADGKLDEPVEEVIDDLVETLRARHTRRLLDGKCTVYGGLGFLNSLTNIERIADQCSNLGIYTIALTDPEIARTHHDYIQHLHQGDDSFFNAEYRAAHEKYFGRLAELAG